MADSISAHNNMAKLVNAQIEQDFIDGQLDKDGGSAQGGQSHQSLQCISCNDMCDPDALTATCGHAYCTGCLPEYVESALQFDSTFPPQCCNRPLTLDLVSDYIGPELTQRYKDKQSSITAACFLACSNPGCRLIITDEISSATWGDASLVVTRPVSNAEEQCMETPAALPTKNGRKCSG